jgi:hypothetical protein
MSNGNGAASALKIEYDGFVIDDALALPHASISAMLSRSLRIILGTEAGSRVNAQYKAEAVESALAAKRDSSGDKAAKLTDAEREAAERDVSYDTDSDEYKARKRAAQQKLFNDIVEGNLGTRTSAGPARDPFQVEVDKIVAERVMGILRKRKVVVDGKEQHIWSGKKNPTDETVFNFPDGTLTFAQIKAGWLRNNEAQVHKEAQAELNRKSRAAKAIEEAKPIEGTASALFGIGA